MQYPDAEFSPVAGLTEVLQGDDSAFVRLHLRLAYDGTDFHGWARQPDQRTVQAVVEDALAVVLRSPDRLPVVCAGRTDAGVHAVDQHIHVDVPRPIFAGLQRVPGPSRMQGPGPANPVPEPHPGPDAGAALPTVVRRLNGLLADDVRILSAEVAPLGFDARFSVIWRQYLYRVADLGPGDPLRRRFVWQRLGELDLEQMNVAARALVGEHNFAALCRHRPDASTVRTVLALEWQRDAATGEAQMRVRADAFCHSMVRSLVGLLVTVGDGTREPSWAQEILHGRRRRPEVVTAPPAALVLEQVAYAADLADQALRSRRFRG